MASRKPRGFPTLGFALVRGFLPLFPAMASSQEKATSGVLRNAAALLDEMQLMGETQGELFQTPLSLLLFCVSSRVLNFALLPIAI